MKTTIFLNVSVQGVLCTSAAIALQADKEKFYSGYYMDADIVLKAFITIDPTGVSIKLSLTLQVYAMC